MTHVSSAVLAVLMGAKKTTGKF